MGLDPCALRRMSMADFHAYAAGFSARHAAPAPEEPSEDDFMSAMVAEQRQDGGA